MTSYDLVSEVTQFHFYHILALEAVRRAPKLPWEGTQSPPLCGTSAEKFAALGLNLLTSQRQSVRIGEGFFR